MKAVFAKVLPGAENEVFSTQRISRAFFSTEFHYHKECQLVYIVESAGKRIIGDSVENFESDELSLLGSEIPHVWHNEEQYFICDSKKKRARSVGLYFHPDKLIPLLSRFADLHKLESMLKKSKRGMIFTGETKERLKMLLLEMTEQEGIPRLITMLNLFNIISTTHEYRLLASPGYIHTYYSTDKERMDKVFKFIQNNFAGPIQLNEVAALANMNKQAFCRYFKSRTQKTFTDFLNNIRISHVCKLITEGQGSISSFAYQCGYNSLSNFNRFFKAVKGMTPGEYKKKVQD